MSDSPIDLAIIGADTGQFLGGHAAEVIGQATHLPMPRERPAR